MVVDAMETLGCAISDIVTSHIQQQLANVKFERANRCGDVKVILDD
jgi:hypothetical protein